MGVSKSYAYKIIKQLNEELQKLGYLTEMCIRDSNNVELYRDTLSFNDNTAQADPNAWDFSSVAEKGYPTLTWL